MAGECEIEASGHNDDIAYGSGRREGGVAVVERSYPAINACSERRLEAPMLCLYCSPRLRAGKLLVMAGAPVVAE